MQTKTDALGLLAKPIKTPWHLRFAPTVKYLVSFVQNLLPSRTPKEASAAAAVLAGIGLLAAPMDQAQSAVPKVSEVILDGYDFFTTGEFGMEVVHSSGSGAQWARPKYCWSGVVFDLDKYLNGHDDPWRWENAEDYSFNEGANKGLHSDDPWKPDDFNRYYHPAYL